MDTGKSIIEEIQMEEWNARGIRVLIKRDDLIHPEISGNKWRKLKYNIALCHQLKKSGILTFGGAYSNHLVATAAACQSAKIKSIGIVRGDELNPDSNDTLRYCAKLGMELRFISREEYALRNDKEFQDVLNAQFQSVHIVPEGGANYYGIIGCQEIMREIVEEVDEVFLAQGTTTTSCGVLLSLNHAQRLHVVPVLKGFDSIAEMKSLLLKSGFESGLIDELLSGVTVYSDAHFGGYGKHPKQLVEFIEQFYSVHHLKLDPIYTGKTMHCMIEQLMDSKFDGKTVLFIHTGGLQGGSGIVNFD